MLLNNSKLGKVSWQISDATSNGSSHNITSTGNLMRSTCSHNSIWFTGFMRHKETVHGSKDSCITVGMSLS